MDDQFYFTELVEGASTDPFCYWCGYRESNHTYHECPTYDKDYIDELIKYSGFELSRYKGKFRELEL